MFKPTDLKKAYSKPMSEKADDAMDKKMDVKEDSSLDKRLDKEDGSVKKSGSFGGKSNKLGHGGRAAQLKAKGVPGPVIGMLARAAGAAPGMSHYHGK